MFFLYDLLIAIVSGALNIAALFSAKLRLFVDGRKNVPEILQEKLGRNSKTIWFHAASLGEYEQGLPVMERVRGKYPGHKIVLTFFSPSGFEVRKNNSAADVTVYLPLDSSANAKKFLDIVNPEIAIFIKYEYWPNYLRELKSRNVKTYLVSGIFRENQPFFKWYGKFYRQALDSFSHFFVQNGKSKELLATIGKTNVTVSGDTRFDRVASILEKNNKLDFVEAFCDRNLTVVIGSSWPRDEELLVGFINRSPEVKFIIAPHNIKEEQIKKLKESISKKTVLFSERDKFKLSEHTVLIVDTIGLLTKIYSYADIAYVGGGFGNPGVHNILEPATFGVPIIIGPNYSHFQEAIALVEMGGCTSVENQQELDQTLEMLIADDDRRAELGHICATFVQMNKNATDAIMKHLDNDSDI